MAPRKAAPVTGAQTPDSSRDAMSMNSVVSYNVRRARLAKGWSQDRMSTELEGYTGRRWSASAVSAVERAADGVRGRRFDANEITAFAVVFQLPVAWFFIPPDDSDPAPEYFTAKDETAPIGAVLRREQVAETVEPFVVPTAFIDRVRALLGESDIEWAPGPRRLAIGGDSWSAMLLDLERRLGRPVSVAVIADALSRLPADLGRDEQFEAVVALIAQDSPDPDIVVRTQSELSLALEDRRAAVGRELTTDEIGEVVERVRELKAPMRATSHGSGLLMLHVHDHSDESGS